MLPHSVRQSPSLREIAVFDQTNAEPGVAAVCLAQRSTEVLPTARKAERGTATRAPAVRLGEGQTTGSADRRHRKLCWPCLHVDAIWLGAHASGASSSGVDMPSARGWSNSATPACRRLRRLQQTRASPSELLATDDQMVSTPRVRHEGRFLAARQRDVQPGAARRQVARVGK